ncbi:hypothetical protein MKFW12EY_09830 [Methylomonas koyamae]|nr:hypothetical protein MKFW12EY_09830 [Methylomonas koyamae]
MAGLHVARRGLPAALASILIAACTPPPPTAALPELAAPQGPTRHVLQLVAASWPGGNASLLCVLELNAQRIALAGTSKDGLSLFNLSYDGENLVLDKNPLLPDTVDPRAIVADMQLIYWPVAALQYRLPPGWHLQTGATRRELFQGEEKIAEIVYLSSETDWPRHAELANLRYGYRLSIDTLSYELVSE